MLKIHNLPAHLTRPYQRNELPSRGSEWTTGMPYYQLLCRVSSMHTREPCQSINTRYATKAWSTRTSPTSAHRAARAPTQKEYRRRTCSNYGNQESGVLGSKLQPGAPSPPTSKRRRTCSLPRFCSQRLQAIHNEIHLGLQTSTAAGIWRGVNTCANDAEADFVERSSRWVGSVSKSGGSNSVAFGCRLPPAVYTSMSAYNTKPMFMSPCNTKSFQRGLCSRGW